MPCSGRGQRSQEPLHEAALGREQDRLAPRSTTIAWPLCMGDGPLRLRTPSFVSLGAVAEGGRQLALTSAHHGWRRGAGPAMFVASVWLWHGRD